MLNLDKIRADFPILKEKVNGKPLVYFDNAATSQKPQCVLDELESYYSSYNSNVHRGVHYLSQKATEKYEQARITIQGTRISCQRTRVSVCSEETDIST